MKSFNNLGLLSRWLVTKQEGFFFSPIEFHFLKTVVTNSLLVTTVSVIGYELATLLEAKINRLLLQKMAAQQSPAKPWKREFQTENAKGHACRGNGDC